MEYHCFSKAPVIARKPHRCIWCGQSIEKSSEYIDERSVYEGRFQRHKWHAECLDDANYWGPDEFIPYSHDRPEPAPSAQPSEGM